MGKPAVLLGERQKGREIGKNISHSHFDEKIIISKIMKQIKKKKFQKEKIYGDGKAGIKILKILEKIHPVLKSQISY